MPDIRSDPDFRAGAVLPFALCLGLASAATFVAGWSSDESSDRFELLLTTPLTRVRWALSSGLGVWLAIAVTVLSVNFVGDGLRDALDPRSRL